MRGSDSKTWIQFREKGAETEEEEEEEEEGEEEEEEEGSGTEGDV